MMHSPFSHAGSIFLKGRPIHLTFFLTRRCNAKCPFCFYLRNSDDKTGSSGELDLAEIKKISRTFGSLLWLAFSGGEIYLRDDLVSISRVFYQNNSPAIMLFPTNGLLPELIRERTEEVLKDCPKSIIAVKLSVDGLGSNHDALRRTPGSFEKTMQTYHLLGELIGRYPNFELGINTVFCSENQDEMDEIIDFAKGLVHVKTHTISLVRGNLSDDSFKSVDSGKYTRAIEKLETGLKSKVSSTYRFRGGKIKAAQDILQRRLIHRTMQEQKRLIPCYAGRLNLVLTEDGEVYPCEILTRSFGNVRDHAYDINRVITSSEAREIIRSIRSNACFCTHECYFMTNILFNPSLYPSLLKEYLQIR
ncbi:MAG: radical SAM protein [Nitrospirae bacterium]|nr:radical SAM protein [Nitrospirota bacterium]